MNPIKGLSAIEQIKKQKEDDLNKQNELANANNKYQFDLAMASQVTNPKTLLENQYNRRDILNQSAIDTESAKIEQLRNLEANQFLTNRLSRDLEITKELERAERARYEMLLKIREFNLKDPKNAFSTDEIDKITKSMDTLSKTNVQEINAKYLTFAQTLVKIFREEITKGLSSGITDLIMETKDLGEVLTNLADNIFAGVLKVAIDSLIAQLMQLLTTIKLFKGSQNFRLDGLFSGFENLGDVNSFGVSDLGGFDITDIFGFGDFGSTSGLSASDFGTLELSGFNKGGLVKGKKLPNYADGGVIESIHDGLRRERMASGREPVLAALTPGERVLSVKQNKRFEELQLNKVLNYSQGGVVGNAPNINVSAPQQSSSVNVNVPVTVEGGQNSNVNPQLLSQAIRGAVVKEIQYQKRPGGALGL